MKLSFHYFTTTNQLLFIYIIKYLHYKLPTQPCRGAPSSPHVQPSYRLQNVPPPLLLLLLVRCESLSVRYPVSCTLLFYPVIE